MEVALLKPSFLKLLERSAANRIVVWRLGTKVVGECNDRLERENVTIFFKKSSFESGGFGMTC